MGTRPHGQGSARSSVLKCRSGGQTPVVHFGLVWGGLD